MPQEITPAGEQSPQIIEREFDIDGFLVKRTEFITKVNAIMVEGKDYHFIQGKKSMAKGGAEKIASIFGWTATFTRDTDVIESFSDLKGIVAFVCNLEKNSQLVGQGRGAAMLSKNANDPNKAIKMAQKSAFIDAVIRASGLSDFYTQDLEDMHPSDISGQNSSPRANSEATANIKPSAKQLELIAKLMKEKGYTKADLIEAGFTGSLTGGKEGTASQIIDLLMKAPVKTNQEELPVIQVEAEPQSGYAKAKAVADTLPKRNTPADEEINKIIEDTPF